MTTMAEQFARLLDPEDRLLANIIASSVVEATDLPWEPGLGGTAEFTEAARHVRAGLRRMAAEPPTTAPRSTT